MPNFDTRTLREIRDGVSKRKNRYYMETRELQELDNIMVDFSHEDAAEDTFGETVNFD